MRDCQCSSAMATLDAVRENLRLADTVSWTGGERLTRFPFLGGVVMALVANHRSGRNDRFATKVLIWTKVYKGISQGVSLSTKAKLTSSGTQCPHMCSVSGNVTRGRPSGKGETNLIASSIQATKRALWDRL